MLTGIGLQGHAVLVVKMNALAVDPAAHLDRPARWAESSERRPDRAQRTGHGPGGAIRTVRGYDNDFRLLGRGGGDRGRIHERSRGQDKQRGSGG